MSELTATPAPGGDEFVLDVRDLRTHFPVGRGALGAPSAWVKAVDGVSFAIRRGETWSDRSPAR